MSDNQTELLSRAIAGLHLRDIVLFESSFKRPNPPPETPMAEAVLQTRRHVTFGQGEQTEAEKIQKILQVSVDLGLRIAASTDAAAAVYFEIEATFLAEYAVRNEIEEDAIKVFAELNSVHNVWPFWRQHIFDVVQRSRIPHIEVPLFAVQSRQETPNTKNEAIGST